MTAKVRVFDFSNTVSLHEAESIIRVALEDEGLSLVPGCQGFRPVYGIRFSGSADGSEPGYLRVVVPVRYIMEGAQG
jgi:hypothetical protein